MAKLLITDYDASLIKTDKILDWLKLGSDSNEDDLITSLVQSAIASIGNICNIAILSQTWENYFNDFPSHDLVKVKMYPTNVSNVTSIKYNDENNAQQTWAAELWQNDLVTQPSYIVPALDGEYPTTDGDINNVIIKFISGWDTWAEVPESLKTAIKMTVTHWYCNRQPVVIGRMVSEIPMTVKYVLENSGYLIKEF